MRIKQKVDTFFLFLGYSNELPLRVKAIFIIFFALIILLEDGCRSHHHKHKKLKPGKPIPCPLKDC
jgi:hypothetical protein